MSEEEYRDEEEEGGAAAPEEPAEEEFIEEEVIEEEIVPPAGEGAPEAPDAVEGGAEAEKPEAEGDPLPVEEEVFQEEPVSEEPVFEAPAPPPEEPPLAAEAGEGGFHEEEIPPEEEPPFESPPGVPPPMPGVDYAERTEASDTYTEVTERSWGDRLGGAVKGVVVGVILFLLGFPLIFWNEGRAVKRYKALKSGEGAVISVSADRVDPANDGKLVHVSGMVATKEVLTDGASAVPRAVSVTADRIDPANDGKLVHVTGTVDSGAVIRDPVFGIGGQAIKLERRVRMYQWTEQGSTYARTWSGRPIDSSGFKQPQGHGNPGDLPYPSKRFAASSVTVGDFALSRELVRELDVFSSLQVTDQDLAAVPDDLKDKVSVLEGDLFVGADPRSPKVGDLRISFRIIRPFTATLVAQQSGKTLRPYTAPSGETVARVAAGDLPAEAVVPAGVSANAIKLKRNVEMYQWREETRSKTEKKLGGKEVTTTEYTYRTDWSPRLIDSGNFKRPQGHRNPDYMPLEEKTWTAETVTLGAYTLPRSMISGMGGFEPLPVKAVSGALPPELRNRARLHQGGYYIGADPAYPKVGDLKVTYSVVRPAQVSLVAKQTGNSFAPYETETGKIQEFTTGTRTADQMFKSAQSRNTLWTWIWRFLGFLVMFIGVGMVLKPISVVLDVVPFLGNLAEKGISIIAFLVAGAFALLTISIAWIFHRPLLGGLLVVAAVALVVGIRMIPRRQAA